MLIYVKKTCILWQVMINNINTHFHHVCQDPVSLVSMSEESPYAKLGDVQPVNLLQFAHQIAAGMVCY